MAATSAPPAAAAALEYGASKLVPTRQMAATIGGQHTEAAVAQYSNCIFLALSQLDTLGTMFHVTRTEDDVEVKPLLGFSEGSMLDVAAAEITKGIAGTSLLRAAGPRQPLLLALAVRDCTPALVASLTKLAVSCIEQSPLDS